MMSDVYRDYLFDVGEYIRTRAFEAKSERDALDKGTADWHFQAGRVLAFNEVISILLQSAEGLGISSADLRLADVVPDRDLV